MTKTSNDLDQLDNSTITQNDVDKHRCEAKIEFLQYVLSLNIEKERKYGNVKHFVFNFAENVLLPKLLKQPGKLNFVTGLKNDIFGVHSSNEHLISIFGLAEGYCLIQRHLTLFLYASSCNRRSVTRKTYWLRCTNSKLTC